MLAISFKDMGILQFSVTFIIGIACIIAAVLVTREVALWYFRINERVALQLKANFLLEELISGQRADKEKSKNIEKTEL